jgi:hypothetical protein
MRIKFNTNLLVNTIVISVVVFYTVIFIGTFYFTHSNIIFHSKYNPGDTYSWNNQLPEIDSPVSTDLPYYKYQELQNAVIRTRDLKNGDFLGAGGAQFGGVIGMGGGVLCDTCTINHDKNDFPVKPLQYYIKLLDWKLNLSSPGQYSPSPVLFYVEHKQSYVRKLIVDSVKLRKDGGKDHKGHIADVPVKFRYNRLQNCIMIPVSKQVRDMVNAVLFCIVILFVIYFFYLIAAFLNFIIDISKGFSFTDKNIFRLKLMAVSLLGFPVLALLLNLILRFIFNSYFTDDVVFNAQLLNDDWIVMGFGIVFLLLFKAFRQGKILKDEQDLTV